MDKFTESEIIGRNLFRELLELAGILLYEFTKGKYDCYDCSYTGNKGAKIAVEIKVRDEKYSCYDTLLMELKKLFALREIRLLFDGVKYVTFLGNKCYIYSVELFNRAKPFTGRFKATTAGNQNYVPKTMYEIEKSKAIILERDSNNKWKRIK